MARKNSGLLARGLEKLRGALSHPPAEPTPAKNPAKKSSAADKRKSSEGSAKRVAAAATSTQTDGADDATQAQPTQEKTHEKKKIPNQPWYRHRQRW